MKNVLIFCCTVCKHYNISTHFGCLGPFESNPNCQLNVYRMPNGYFFNFRMLLYKLISWNFNQIDVTFNGRSVCCETVKDRYQTAYIPR